MAGGEESEIDCQHFTKSDGELYQTQPSIFLSSSNLIALWIACHHAEHPHRVVHWRLDALIQRYTVHGLPVVQLLVHLKLYAHPVWVETRELYGEQTSSPFQPRKQYTTPRTSEIICTPGMGRELHGDQASSHSRHASYVLPCHRYYRANTTELVLIIAVTVDLFEVINVNFIIRSFFW